MATSTVYLIGSAAPLLSGSLQLDCLNAKDPTCKGGVASVAAHIRHHANTSYPILVCPRLDSQHEFVQMHPMGWNVNTKVLNEHFGWTVFTADPSLLSEGENVPADEDDRRFKRRDVSGLQTPNMPLLLTNVLIPPSNSWRPYVQMVHFDPKTNLALISLEDEQANDELGWSQVESAIASLDFVAAQNRRKGCQQYVDIGALITGDHDEQEPCWIPILSVYKSANSTSFDSLIQATTNHDNPPALIVDWEGTQKAYSIPKVTDQLVWIISQELTSKNYIQYTITVDQASQRISDLNLVTANLEEMPPDWKDKTYGQDIAFLRTLADEAMAHDPILGNSNAMPRADTGQCQREECEVGNLIADSLKWKTKADIAFVLGQRMTGPGWSFGQIHLSDIFYTLPTPTAICTGQISGRALIRVLEHAYGNNTDSSYAEPESNTSTASLWAMEALFLQVSGLQVVYNSLLRNSTNLVSVKIWDQQEEAYLNLNPFRLYQFATEQDVCDPDATSYARLLQADELKPKQGGDNADIRIRNTLLQNIVGDYLRQLDTTLVPFREDRLKDDPSAMTVFDIYSTSSGACPSGAFWDAEQQNCLSCPSSSSYVTLSDTLVEFNFQGNTTEPQMGRVVVVNRDLHDYLVVSKNIPDWFVFAEAKTLEADEAILWPYSPVKLPSGEKIAFDFSINASRVGPGTTYGTVYFNITSYETIPECLSEKYALALDALVQVTPPDTVMTLGKNAIVGMVLMSSVLLACTGLGIWVFLKRGRWGYGSLGDKSGNSLQPLYWGTICLGTFIMALTIAAWSVDEGTMSGSTCSNLCLVAPWLLSLGLTLVFAALLSKLITAQRVPEKRQEHLAQVNYKDLATPFAVLFVINFGILFMMLIDPPTWSRSASIGEEWNLYGFCDYGNLGSSLLISSCVVHLLTLLYTGYQAYRASYHGNEFKFQHDIMSIGLSLFSWFQIAIVAIPTWFALDDENVMVKYYFKVGVVIALCLSMLLCIFVPVTMNTSDYSKKQAGIEAERLRLEENHSMFTGFMGFSSLPGIKIPDASEDEEIQREDRNRCLADRICF